MTAKLSALKSLGAALITGASSGIGAAFAEALAELGVDLILVSRQHAVLQQLAASLRQRYGITVHVFSYDLADPTAPSALYAELKHTALNIDLLINNAGYVDYANFVDLSWQQHQALLQTMLTSVMELSYLYIRDKLQLTEDSKNEDSKNKSQAANSSQPMRAAIINTASLAGLIERSAPSREQQMMLYGSIKACIASFSQRLFYAYRAQGLYCQALCPGLTWSEFHKRAGESELYHRVPRFFWQTSESVVRQSLGALVKRRRSVVVPGVINRCLLFIARCFSLCKF